MSNLSNTGNAHFQAPLVSGTNIKTINGNSILGSGDLTVSGGANTDLSNLSATGEAHFANPSLSNLTAAGNLLVFKAGMIIPWGGTSLNKPDGWLVCDGSTVSRTTYAGLFAIIGTAYGGGDGSTTFNLPDFTGRWAGGNGNGYLSAGLPNITGTLPAVNSILQANLSGVFAADVGGANGHITSASGSSYNKVRFNASWSSNIYGSASTVQPATCKSYWLIKY